MDTIEITKQLQKLKTEPRYTMHKGKDTEFYVKSFSITNRIVHITTTIDKHQVDAINFDKFIALWRTGPKEAAKPIPTTSTKSNTAHPKQEVSKNPKITGAAAKYVHITSPVTVYVTKDYKMFRHTLGNRVLNKHKIKKIVHDIQNGLNRLADYPIVVDPATMEVEDGQHRLDAAIQTIESIYYIFASPMKLHEIARVNSNTERWKTSDFLKCYINQGNEHYQALHDFVELSGFPVALAIKLLSGWKTTSGGADPDLKNKYEQGRFVTTEKHIHKAKDLATTVKRFDKFPSYKSAPFISAIEVIKEKNLCDFDRLLDKFSKNPERLRPTLNRKEYINQLDLIYNIGNQKLVHIF